MTETPARQRGRVPGEAIRDYLRSLHEPPHASVDWRTAPARYKRYPDATRVVLPWAVPVAPGRMTGTAVIAALLRDLLGLVRANWTHPLDRAGRPTGDRPALRTGRSAPSDEALHPIEAYLASGPEKGLPAALYHYDAAHHALETVRAGDHRADLTAVLSAAPARQPDVLLVLSTVFWRSMFRHGEAGYRLQCQEAGTLLAQVLAVAESLGAAAGSHTRFRDVRLDRLLGLDSARESSLALVTLTLPGGAAPGAGAAATEPRLAGAPAASVPVPVPRRVPAAAALHAAGQADGEEGADLSGPSGEPPGTGPFPAGPLRELPEAEAVRLADGVVERHSPRAGFRPVPVSARALATVLAAACAGYSGDLPGAGAGLVTVTPYVVVVRVEGMPAGAYRYDPKQGALIEVAGASAVMAVAHGPLRESTRLALRGAAAILLPAGDPLAGVGWFGDRWYRLQQIEAGMVAQRATLAARGAGLAARVHSDGTNEVTDAVLGLAGTSWQSLCFLTLGEPARRGSVLSRHLVPAP